MVMSDVDPYQPNEFDAPIPGQSLAGDKEMGAYPWENPPDFPDPDEFYEFTVDKLLNDEENLMNVVKLVEMEIPVNTIADGILMNSFMMGQITPQVAIISKDPIIELLMVIAQEAGVQPVLSDPSVSRTEETQIDAAMAELANQEAPGDATTPMMMAGGEEVAVEAAPHAGIMAPPSGDDGIGGGMMPMMPLDEELPLEDV